MDRRTALKVAGLGGAGLALGDVARAETLRLFGAEQSSPLPAAGMPWNYPGPLVSYPDKLPLIVLTDRPVQLETPRAYFQSALTPNAAFFVRWHLDLHPNAVSLAAWRLHVEGNVSHPVTLSFDELVTRFPPASVTAVNQCSGNSRSRFSPRVTGGQWGNGAMGCARWEGVPLRALLEAAGVKPGSVAVQFEGLDRGHGPEGRGSHEFMKSLALDDRVIDEALVAYAMNGEPLPMLNGFPVRLVVPGYFATYWVKCLTRISVLDRPDENFWMKNAYRVPNTRDGTTTPDAVKAGGVAMVPITRMPVRSFIATPDGSAKLPAGLPVTIRGVAFSGHGGVTRVEVSTDGGRTWRAARLGGPLGPHAFRTWDFAWTPRRPGSTTLAVRATDMKGSVQRDEAVWNPGGYLWNRIESQAVVVGPSA